MKNNQGRQLKAFKDAEDVMYHRGVKDLVQRMTWKNFDIHFKHADKIESFYSSNPPHITIVCDNEFNEGLIDMIASRCELNYLYKPVDNSVDKV